MVYIASFAILMDRRTQAGRHQPTDGFKRSVGLAFLLRAGRVTRYLAAPRGFYRLRAFYQRRLPGDFLARVRFDGDLRFDVRLTDNLGLFLWHFPRCFEKEEIAAFCSLIRPGCVVLDVGANIGLYSLLAAKRGARVFAIEADPYTAALLRHHVKLNGLEERITVFEMAAADTDGKMPLFRHPLNLGESNIIGRGDGAETVDGRAIDSLNLPPVDICKMDIEGSELQALWGMEQTIERSHGLKLFVECAESFGNRDKLMAYLEQRFSKIQVLEGLEQDGAMPAFCNLLATQ